MSCCGHAISCTLSLHVYYNKAHYSLVTPVSSLCRVNAGEQSFNIIPAFLISIASMLIPHWGKQGESATPSLPADSPARSTAGTLFPLAVLGISTQKQTTRFKLVCTISSGWPTHEQFFFFNCRNIHVYLILLLFGLCVDLACKVSNVQTLRRRPGIELMYITLVQG